MYGPVIWKAFIGLGPVGGAFDPGVLLVLEALLRTRSSIVSGTASLINFDSINPSEQIQTSSRVM